MILIGESRDEETASAAVKCRADGRTSSSPRSMPMIPCARSRVLFLMGVAPYLLADSLALSRSPEVGTAALPPLQAAHHAHARARTHSRGEPDSPPSGSESNLSARGLSGVQLKPAIVGASPSWKCRAVGTEIADMISRKCPAKRNAGDRSESRSSFSLSGRFVAGARRTDHLSEIGCLSYTAMADDELVWAV